MIPLCWIVQLLVVVSKCDTKQDSTIEQSTYSDWSQRCQEFNHYRPVLFEKRNPSSNGPQFGELRVVDDWRARLDAWTEWYRAVSDSSMDGRDIICRISQLVPRHDGRDNPTGDVKHKQARASWSVGAIGTKDKSLLEWVNEPYRLNRATPYLSHIIVEVVCRLGDRFQFQYELGSEEYDASISGLAGTLPNIELQYGTGRKTLLDNIQRQRILYAATFNILTPNKHKGKRIARRKHTQPNVILLELESATYKDIIHRQHRLKDQLDEDGFAIFQHHQVAGWNTVPNQLAVTSGVRDHEYLNSLPIYNRGDISTSHSLQQHAQTNGYWTSHFIDRWHLWTLYSDRGPRPTSDVDGPFLLLCYERIRTQLGHGAINPATDWCLEDGTAGQYVSKQIEGVLLSDSSRPAFVTAAFDVISHEANNNSSQESGILSLLRGPARASLMNDSIVILFGDHGHRTINLSSKPYATYAWYQVEWEKEQYHPFMAVRLPDKLTLLFPHLKKVLEQNTNKLTTHVDIYETVMDVLYNRIPTGKETPDPVVTPMLLRYPNFRINSRDPVVRNRTFGYLGNEWGHNWITAKSNCDYGDLRDVADMENEILKKNSVPYLELQQHPYIRFAKQKVARPLEAAAELSVAKPACPSLTVPSIHDLLHSPAEIRRSYYPLSKIAGYHSWGDAGISLWFPISHERNCQDIGIPLEMCICDGSNPLIIIDIRDGIKNDDGKSLYDYHMELLIKTKYAMQFQIVAPLRDLLPGSQYGDEIFSKAKELVQSKLIGRHIAPNCVNAILEFPKRIMSDYVTERSSNDRVLSIDNCIDDVEYYYIYHLESLGNSTDAYKQIIDVWKLYFVGPAGATFRVIFATPASFACLKNETKSHSDYVMTVMDISYDDPPRYDSYSATSKCVDEDWAFAQRWKQICICREL